MVISEETVLVRTLVQLDVLARSEAARVRLALFETAGVCAVCDGR